jgi:hypothetical protein
VLGLGDKIICMEEHKTPDEASLRTETEETTPQTMDTEPVAAPVALPTQKNSNTLLLVAVALAVIIAAGLYYYFQTGTEVSPESATTPASVIDADNYPDVVATVNGEELPKEMFIRSYTQMSQSAAQQGADLTSPEVIAELEVQAMDTLINTALLVQAAKASGIQISDEAIEGEIDTIKGQFESEAAFTAVLEERGITDEMLRSDIKTELLVNEFITKSDAMGTASVTEAEVAAMYEQLSAGQTEVPALEEVYPVIEQQLISQKQNELIGSYILGLREKAQIETHLE